ncbi:hypothetical protein PMAYCL1PPCAC_12693, partial [Pristionchus mayeri]
FFSSPLTMPEVSIQTDPTPQEEQARNVMFDEMASLDHDLATLLDYTNRLIHNHRRITRAILEKESLSLSSSLSSSHPEDPEDPPSLEIPSLSTINPSPPSIDRQFPLLNRGGYPEVLAELTPLPPSSFIFSSNGSLIRLTSNDSLASPSSSSHSSSSTPSSPSSIPVSSPLTSPLSSKNNRYSPY